MTNTDLNKIYYGDCNEVLKDIPSNSVDLVITSPPYFQQREYGGTGIGNEKTAEEYIENAKQRLAEVSSYTYELFL